jgi:hypothetical protein
VTSKRAWLRLGTAATAMLALPLLGAGLAAVPARAVPSGALHLGSGPGYCTTDEGVTVVVDMTAFDGPIVVRCVDGPLGSSYTGWDALKDAGFSPQAPSRTPGFVCRVGGEPAASRSLDIPESSDYHEQCVNTPPTSAYWGYWYANNGGRWTYSSTGAAGHRVTEGGFEGWGFALNKAGRPPKPGVEPSHRVEPTTSPPGATEGPSGDSPTKPDQSGGNNGSGGGGSGGGGSGGSTSEGGDPTPTTSNEPTGKPEHEQQSDHDSDSDKSDPPTSAAAGPTSAPTTDDVVVTGELPKASNEDDSGGSAGRTLVGLGVLAVLAGGAGVTAWRRSHRA